MHNLFFIGLITFILTALFVTLFLTSHVATALKEEKGLCLIPGSRGTVYNCE